jgi:hypothetical protein
MPSATDAITGDPAAVASTARTLTSIADDVARHAARLRSLASSGSSWTGTAATRAHARTVTLPPKLDKVTASYGAAGSALLRYAGALADATARSRAAVSAFTRADDELRSARAAQAAAASSDDAAAATAAAAGLPAPAPTAPRYQASIDAALAARTRAAATNARAHADRDRAASVAAAALKGASRQGIPNKSWWQHFTHSAAHWLSAQWRDALSHLAEIGGTISVIAGIAAAVLAVGGLMFPPLEAAAAAAEGIAAVSGVLSAGSAAANDLTTPGHRRDGLLDLGMAALPGPASKLLRKLPISANTGVLAIKGIPRTVPLGMRDEAEFRALGMPLRKRLTELGYPNAVIRIRGSSVTGVSYETKLPFDAAGEGESDYDLAIGDRHLFEDVQKLGADMATATRTWPLDRTGILNALGLEGVRQQMTRAAGREVSFMIYKDDLAITRRGSSLRFPR